MEEKEVLNKIFKEVDKTLRKQKEMNKKLKKLVKEWNEQLSLLKQKSVSDNINLTKSLNLIDEIVCSNESIKKRKKQKIEEILKAQDKIDDNLCFLKDMLNKITEINVKENLSSS